MPGGKVGVLVVHGMGSQRRGFSGELRSLLKKCVRSLGGDPRRLVFVEGLWSKEIQHREDRFWKTLEAGARMDWKDERRLALSALGDAVAYQRVPGRWDGYRSIHGALHGCLAALKEKVGDPGAPVVVLAHSLGAAIMSNYIWDEQTGKGLGTDAFERLETLAGLVTYGTTIPLFLLPHEEVVPIAFPPPGLDPALKGVAKWLNLYDPDDVLGWPIRPLFPDSPWPIDTVVEVGGFLTGATPLAHTQYEEDGDFLKPVAGLLRDILAATP